jgi:nudix-type nucleoside diphosphatase (YffH/AdpP family)
MRKVSIENKRYILNDFFKVEEAYLRFEQFNGEMSPLVRRLNLDRGDSVGVLIFNQTAEKLILVSQFRYAAFLKEQADLEEQGYLKKQGWTIEAIAGMVDPGETPEQSARREVEEETGLNIDILTHITTFYPSPGGSSERIFFYYSEVSGERAKYKETGGILASGEDVKAVEITVAEAMAKIKSGEIEDAKTIIGIYWLENRLMKKQRL